MIATQDLLALGAALCWATTGFISHRPSRFLGPIAFVRWRMLLVLLLLWPAAWLRLDGGWGEWDQIAVMLVSGIAGIALGDVALFAALNRLGPRLTSVIFATHALFSALLGYLWLQERLGWLAYLGACIAVSGVMVAVAWGKHRNDQSDYEPQGSVKQGVAFGLLAAFCQALGALLAKPVLSASGEHGEIPGMDPVYGLALRVSAALLVLVLWALIQQKGRVTMSRPPWEVLWMTALSAWIGMGLGMMLLLWALSLGSVGAVGVLSSMTPIMILPLLWLKLKRPPALGAWLGAALAVCGSALVMARHGLL